MAALCRRRDANALNREARRCGNLQNCMLWSRSLFILQAVAQSFCQSPTMLLKTCLIDIFRFSSSCYFLVGCCCACFVGRAACSWRTARAAAADSAGVGVRLTFPSWTMLSSLGACAGGTRVGGVSYRRSVASAERPIAPTLRSCCISEQAVSLLYVSSSWQTHLITILQ